MGRVTLVGETWARPGRFFLNEQPCEVAPVCPLARACQNLPWDLEFEVRSVRDVHHDACAVHEGGVRVVEVEPAPLRASLPASKTRGSAARWSPPVCRHRGCPNWERCFPHGLREGSEYEVIETGPRLECPMGYELVAVTFRAPRSMREP